MGILGVLLGYVIRDAAKAGPGGPSREEGHAIEAQFDKRQRDPNFEQLAGKKCTHCKSNIVAQPDGQRCPTCKKAIHNGCADRHLSKCGAPAAPPYR